MLFHGTIKMESVDITLSDDQKEIYDLFVKKRKSIFLTGSAGTGKSLLLKTIVRDMRATYGNKSVAVTASTGSAAASIGGCTIHSYAGIGKGDGETSALVNQIKFSRHGMRWRETTVLIIDEISMISAELFDKLATIAREVRNNTNGFGGMQLMVCGDFAQLPPITPYDSEYEAGMAFQARLWEECLDAKVGLQQPFRQSNMKFFLALLCVRLGMVEEGDENDEFLHSLEREPEYDDDEKPVELMSRRDMAETINQERLNCLDADSEEMYSAVDTIRVPKARQALEQTPPQAELRLRIGAQVMLVKNMSNELVNGTAGVVTGFTKNVDMNESGMGTIKLPKVKFTMSSGRTHTKVVSPATWEVNGYDGSVHATRTQIPLILAWAVTIHKSQGKTIQRLKVNLAGVFSTGQTYVALSRGVDPEHIQLLNYRASTIKADQRALTYYLENDLC